MAKKQSAKTDTKKSGAKNQKKGSQVAQSRSGGQRQARSGGPLKFARDVRGELKKVNWPDRPQLQQSTAIVIILVIVLMAYVYAWDFVFRSLARFIFA